MTCRLRSCGPPNGGDEPPPSDELDGPFAVTPEPPYFAVIFTTTQTDELEDYEAVAAETARLAEDRDGWVGVESTRSGAFGITVSSWRDEASIAGWGDDPRHVAARRPSWAEWYERTVLRVAKVERVPEWRRFS